MGISTTAMMIASTAVSAVGAISQGKAASAQAKYQAQIANQQAERARQMGELQALSWITGSITGASQSAGRSFSGSSRHCLAEYRQLGFSTARK